MVIITIMTKMDDLPPEILSYIFSRMLDGRSVAKCKRVCARWYKLIQHLEKSSHLWMNAILREAGIDIAIEMAGNESIDSARTNVDLAKKMSTWKRLYVKWQLTRNVNGQPARSEFNWKSAISELNHRSTVTCVFLIDGRRFMTGHSDGCCALWTNVDGHESVDVVVNHIHAVSDIDVVDFSDGGDYCYYNQNIQSNGEHKHVIIASRKSAVKALCLNCPHRSNVDDIFPPGNNLACFRIFGQYLMFLRVDSVMQILELSLTGDCHLESTHLFSHIYGLPNVRSIFTRWATLWDNKVICVGRELHRKAYDLNSSSWSAVTSPSWINSITEWSRICVVPSVYLFRNGITVLVTIDKYLMLSVDGEKFMCYVTLKHLGGYVTAAHIYGGILVLGTNTGKLFVYTFKKDEELLNLPLENSAYNTKISKMPVCAINIKCDSNSRIILKAIASGDSNIVELIWNHLENQTGN